MLRTIVWMMAISLGAMETLGAQELPRRGVLGVGFKPVPAEVASQLGLEQGRGVIAMKPIAGLTGDRAGIQEGDLIASIQGKPIEMATVASIVRELPSGEPTTFSIFRQGKAMELTTNLQEKARDPGNERYEVIYSHVVSHGKRMRTIITKPKSSGAHPGLLFIQGFSPVSYDFTLEGSRGDVGTIDGPILSSLANAGYVTLRVEKPGVGDSEGGPFADVDFTTELDIYRQALKQLKGLDGVDRNQVFIFGHSMGGAFGPMLASENRVRGIAVYGVAARTWFEYLADTLRYQGLVAGDNLENADEKVRQGMRIMSLALFENMSADEIKSKHPQLEPMTDALLPQGMFSGKTLDFWRQLANTNMASYWTQANTHVLAVRGASDFVTYDVDHKLVADIINSVKPGWGKSMTLPESDHLFHRFATEQQSMQNFQRGAFNSSFTELLMNWLEEVRNG